MIDWGPSSNTLNKILPFLAQEKAQREQVRDWLARNLQQITAQEAANRRLEELRTRNRVTETALTAAADPFKDMPGGSYSLLPFLKSAFPSVTQDITVPPEGQGIVEGIVNNLGGLYQQYGQNKELSPEMLKAIIPRVSEKLGSDLVIGGAKNRLEVGQQGLTAAGQKLTEKGQGLEGRRIAVEEGKLKLEQAKPPGGGKDLISQMKEAQNDRSAALQKYAGVGQMLPPSAEAQAALTAEIKYANSRIDASAKGIGFDSPIKTPKEMQMVGLTILNRFLQTHEIPNWYTLLEQGYDPDFVFGLHDALEKPNKAVKDPDAAAMAKAAAILQQLTGGAIK